LLLMGFLLVVLSTGPSIRQPRYTKWGSSARDVNELRNVRLLT